MVEEIVRKAEQAGVDIRLLDDRKMSISWAGAKGFARELLSDGLRPALVMGVIGGAVAALGGVAMLLTGAAPTALAVTVAYTAGATAAAAAAFIGGRGAIEEMSIARKTNTEIDHAIELLEKEGFSKSKQAEKTGKRSFLNTTSGVSLDGASPDTPKTSISTRDAIITGVANSLDKFSEAAMDMRPHR